MKTMFLLLVTGLLTAAPIHAQNACVPVAGGYGCALAYPMPVIYQAAVVPFQQGHADALEAVTLGAPPLRHFMLKYAREKDLALFLDLAQAPRPARADDVPMRVVVPAYILSELKTGFQIGVALFLPFLVIDLVVAAVTTSIGMMQLPPVIISTPLKILLFVMVDGWNLLVGSLMKSFA